MSALYNSLLSDCADVSNVVSYFISSQRVSHYILYRYKVHMKHVKSGSIYYTKQTYIHRLFICFDTANRQFWMKTFLNRHNWTTTVSAEQDIIFLKHHLRLFSFVSISRSKRFGSWTLKTCRVWFLLLINSTSQAVNRAFSRLLHSFTRGCRTIP